MILHLPYLSFHKEMSFLAKSASYFLLQGNNLLFDEKEVLKKQLDW
jgi:hypothetical protein